MQWVILLPLFFLVSLAVGRGLYDGFAGKARYNQYYIKETEKTETTEEIDTIKNEHIENLDKRIDGYTLLIKTLDKQYKEETDTKKQAAILKQLLAALEKLDKTTEKREKFE